MTETSRHLILEEVVLAKGWGKLSRFKIDYTRSDGKVQTFFREVYDHGHAAAVLPYNRATGSVILVKQFRFPLTLSGENPFMLEACAGLLDADDPVTCARREAEEETGYVVDAIEHVIDVFSSPGSLTERCSLFLAEYDAEKRIGTGGGLVTEGEDIEVIEMPFSEAWEMLQRGEVLDFKAVILLQQLALKGVFPASA